jgi:hypothetical protein
MLCRTVITIDEHHRYEEDIEVAVVGSDFAGVLEAR